eukprot:1160266-Pelagomonas_calceolata.AAC.7
MKSLKHVQQEHFLAPDALLRRLLSTLVTKIRHGLLLVTLLIPIDLFLRAVPQASAWSAVASSWES